MDDSCPPKPNRRRFFRFSLRTLMIVIALCAFGVFLKLQLDWHRKLRIARDWVKPLVDGSISFDLDEPSMLRQPMPACPAILSREQRLEVLDLGISNLKSPRERTAAVKLLVELYPGSARHVLLRTLRQSRDPEIRALSLRLLGLHRRREDVDTAMRLLEDDDFRVRAAACDALGLIRQPAYRIPFERQGWLIPACYVRSEPPISLTNLISMVRDKGKSNARSKSRVAQSVGAFEPLPDGLVELPATIRDALEQRMLAGETAEERTAAARALVTWPTEGYRLRVAEWGVWINDGGELKLIQSVLDEIPPFVHRTGNRFASFRDRINRIMIVTKPIVHLTVDRPLAVDLDVKIAWGRPWYAYPRPDDFSTNVGMLQGSVTRLADGQLKEDKRPAWLGEFDRGDLSELKDIREGFPWLYPSHRASGSTGGFGFPYNAIVDLGLRWQSLIVAPARQNWMIPPDVGSEEHFEWWKRLRQVPSSWISSRGETERFLYYDGPTFARSPVSAKLDGATLEIAISEMFPNNVVNALGNQKRTSVDVERLGLFVQVQGGKVTAYRLAIAAESARIVLSKLTPVRGDEAARHLLTVLTARGLTHEEAAGLCDCWRKQFFESPGQRLITVLSNDDYDAMCPLEVRPRPTELTRVGIVLTEFPGPHRR